MPYTHSQSGIGKGSILAINTGTTTTPIWTTVGEIATVALSGRQVSTATVTNLQSSYQEFLPVMAAEGDLALTGNRVSSDAGQIAVEAAFNNLTVPQFQLTLPLAASQTTSGDKYAFIALVTDSNFTVSFDKAIGYDVKLKISGGMTFTAGA